MTDRDLDDYGYDSHAVVDINGTEIVIRSSNGTDMLLSELQQLDDDDLDLNAIADTSQHSSIPANSNLDAPIANFTLATAAVSNASDVRPWNISAADLDESRKRFWCINVSKSVLIIHHSIVATTNLETHQKPNGDAIDIIALSELYIMGQVESSNTTSRDNTTVSHAHRRQHHHHHPGSHLGHSHAVRHKRRAVEGPIQCGLGKPCKDGACCNKDGKWLVSAASTNPLFDHAKL